MIYVLIGMSLLFIAIGFIVNENNADTLLSGYNTLSKEEKGKFNLKDYIRYFRNFHLFLGISFLVAGLLLSYFINENACGIFLGVYPILAYIYFLSTITKYSKGINTNKWNKIGIFVLVGALIVVIVLFGIGFKEDKLIINTKSIELRGSYGEILTPMEIETIELISGLPKITMKTNGFALGTINKGYFKTENGEVIKLILNADHKPFILITKKSGEKVYYSAKEDDNEKIYSEIKEAFPDILYKP